MVRAAFLTVLAMSVMGAGCLDPAAPAGTEDGDGELGEWVSAQGRTRTYELHEPAGWNRTTPAGVVIALHGASGSAAGFHAQSGLDPVADRLGLIAVYPDGVEGTWSVECGGCFVAELLGVDDLAFLETLLAHLARFLPVDRERVYMLGFSNGGMLATLAACGGFPGLVGIGAVGAPLPRGVAASCTPAVGLAVVHAHGTADALLPWDGRPGSGELWPWLPVPETLARWAELVGCEPAEPLVTPLVGSAGEEGAVERWDWVGCPDPARVRLYRVEGGAHAWYRGSASGLETASALLDFLVDPQPAAIGDGGSP